MNKLKLANSQKGFTLIELMMCVVIASVSILAVVNVSQNINQASLSQASTSSADNIASIVAQNLRFQSTCSTTIRNGATTISFNNAQALTTAEPSGLPLAITLEGLRAGPTANINQITGSNNAVTSGTAPNYAGATSDLSIMDLRIRRIAFQKIAQDSTGTRHFGFVYMDLEKDDTGGKVILGGNAIRRKYLGGVILVESVATLSTVTAILAPQIWRKSVHRWAVLSVVPAATALEANSLAHRAHT